MTRESNVRERFCARVSTQPRSFARRDVWTRTRAPTSGRRHTDDDGKRPRHPRRVHVKTPKTCDVKKSSSHSRSRDYIYGEE